TSGTVRTVADITNPMAGDPLAVSTTRATGYDIISHPLLTAVGQADSAGDLLFWSTTAAGDLDNIRTTTAGTTTTIGATTVANATSGWSTHEVALGAANMAFNHSDVGFSSGGNQSFDGTYAYAAGGLQTGTLDNGAQIMTNMQAGLANCRTWAQFCPA